MFYSCITKQQTIQFKPVSENEFNFKVDSSFAVPHGKIWDERKRIHDSCMGSSYDANAFLMLTKDSLRLGTIVNMKTMKALKSLDLQNFSNGLFSSAFTFTSKPCYEKRPLNIPIESFLNSGLHFKIDSSNEKINMELREVVRNSIHTEIETGSWLNIEMTDALGKILDTTTDESLIEYKTTLLTPGNMILVRSSSITEISFYFHSKNPLPSDLQKKLMGKPIAYEQPFLKAQLFYLDSNSFELKLNGFFQMVGQFMKCELQ